MLRFARASGPSRLLSPCPGRPGAGRTNRSTPGQGYFLGGGLGAGLFLGGGGQGTLPRVGRCSPSRGAELGCGLGGVALGAPASGWRSRSPGAGLGGDVACLGFVLGFGEGEAGAASTSGTSLASRPQATAPITPAPMASVSFMKARRVTGRFSRIYVVPLALSMPVLGRVVPGTPRMVPATCTPRRRAQQVGSPSSSPSCSSPSSSSTSMSSAASAGVRLPSRTPMTAG